MSEPVDSNLLARYLSDECSAEERTQVENALAADPALRRMVGQLRTVWHASNVCEHTTYLDEQWHQIAQRTGIGPSPADQGPLDRHIAPLFSAIRRYAAVAAFLIACFATCYGVSSIYTASERVTLQTQNGEHTKYTLSDGTMVWLDAGSTLRYPDGFTDDTRIVSLSGEAYFSVASDSSKLFLVQAEHGQITVTGTAFNVRSWPNEQKTIVAVVEGQVVLAAKGDASSAVSINPGQSSSVAINNSPSTPRPTDVLRHTAWMQRKAYFDNVPLSDILSQLERWYNVQCDLSNASVAQERLTIQLDAHSLNNALHLVTKLTDLQYERVGDHIILTSEQTH